MMVAARSMPDSAKDLASSVRPYIVVASFSARLSSAKV